LAWPFALSRLLCMMPNYDPLLGRRTSSLKIKRKTVSKSSSSSSSSSDDDESFNAISLNLFIYNPNGSVQSNGLVQRATNKKKNSPRQFLEHLGCGEGAKASRRGLDRDGERRVTCSGAQAR
jgi:hypothetical protein